jgi:hypothetical protein
MPKKDGQDLSYMTMSLPKTSTTCVTFRIPIQKLTDLRTESEAKQVSFNTLVNQIIKEHLEWHTLASQAKLYYMPKSFLMRVIEQLAEEELDELARDTAKNDIVDVSLFLRGSFTLSSLSNITETWLRISRIPHRFETHEDHDRIIIEHDMGFKYSYFIRQIARYVLEVALEAKMSCDITDNTVVLKLYQ